MGGGAAVRLPAVAAPADDGPAGGDDLAAYRDIAIGNTAAGQVDGLAHIVLIRHWITFLPLWPPWGARLRRGLLSLTREKVTKERA